MNFHCRNLSSRFNRQAQLKSDPSQYTTPLNSTTRKYCSTKCYFKVILWRDLKINCFHLYSNVYIWLHIIVNGDGCLPLKKSWWNTNFLVVRAKNFREPRNNWKGSDCFSGRNVSNRNSCSISSIKPSLILVSGFRGRFSVNGTGLYKW